MNSDDDDDRLGNTHALRSRMLNVTIKISLRPVASVCRSFDFNGFLISVEEAKRSEHRLVKRTIIHDL